MTFAGTLPRAAERVRDHRVVSSTDLTQLMTALTAFVAALGGVATFVAARLSKRQRELTTETRDLREYAAQVASWGFRVRMLMLSNGLTFPPMPSPPWDKDDKSEQQAQPVSAVKDAPPAEVARAPVPEPVSPAAPVETNAYSRDAIYGFGSFGPADQPTTWPPPPDGAQRRI
jgi:hypothetical protein